MAGPVVPLDAHAPPLVRERCRQLADLLARLSGPRPRDDADDDASAVEAVLDALWEAGCLSFLPAGEQGSREAAETVVQYVAGDGAVRAVVKAEDPARTDSSAEKRHRKLLRTSEGAVLSFPWENGAGALHVFITDWSPCPAACALAVHRYHPAVRACRRAPLDVSADDAAFTGDYVRHPLTGDLLPVWVADWVRPDFGTGAVLVNPGHDQVDLNFGRRIGLPIRFALTDHPGDDSPAAWPEPPVIKRGATIRTGPHDGLPFDQGRQRYFELLQSRGFAEAATDAKLPAQELARLRPNPQGGWTFEPATGRLRRANDSQATAHERRVELRPLGALRAAASLQAGRVPVMVLARAELEGEFLAFRLLSAELRLAAAREVDIVSVHDVQLGKNQDPDVDPLTLLVAANPDEPAVVRPQLVEQVDTFLDRHRKLRARGPGEDDAASRKLAQEIDHRLRQRRTGAAFAALYKWQKDLFKAETPPPAAYLDLARTLAPAVDDEEAAACAKGA